MTRDQWDQCLSPEEMLRAAGASSRKLRLLAAACCRLAYPWSLLTHEDSFKAIEVAERFADGLATAEELAQAEELAIWAADDLSWSSGELVTWAAYYVSDIICRQAVHAAGSVVRSSPSTMFPGHLAHQDVDRQEQCHLFRDIFNPFRTATFDPVWRTDTVVRLAAASYEERALPSGHLDPARLAVLADSLEDAGCGDAELLAHLRSAGPHVRGCWALDAVLGRG